MATRDTEVAWMKKLSLLLDSAEWVVARHKEPQWRDPFPVEALQQWVHNYNGQWTWMALRDACLVALRVRSMRRALELASLRVADVETVPGGLVVRAMVQVGSAGMGTHGLR
jgi:hypothetical protein